MNGHGTQINPITGVASGKTITAPTAPTTDGFTFDGWYKEEGCTNAWSFETDTVTKNTTLYAKWTQNQPATSTFKAVFNTSTGALKFYYDNVDYSGANVTVYEDGSANYLFDSTKQYDEKWGYSNKSLSVKSVIIDRSVASYNGLTSTERMFSGMVKAENINGAEHLNVSNVTNMSYMFKDFGKESTELNVVPNVSGWNTAKVTNMGSMFEAYGEKSTALDKVPNVSEWKTANVTNMSAVFSNYGKGSTVLAKVPDVSKWSINNVTDLSFMFSSYANVSTAGAFTLDLSGWSVANVTSYRSMFNEAGNSTTNWNVTIPAKTGERANDSTHWYVGNGTDTTKSIAPASGRQFTLAVSGIKYMDWDADAKKLVEKSATEAIEVTSETTTLDAGKFYVVKGEVSTAGLVVNGTTDNPTTLILADGATLNATSSDDNAGIGVASDKALIITGQSGGTGNLIAYGGTGGAGIGGGYTGTGGDVTINGGKVTATGGSNGGAGIGGGANGIGGTVTINGGTVTATGSGTGIFGGAGIGGSYRDGGTVVINGGTITATGKGAAAGIGGGYQSAGGDVTINGGTVTAIGGYDNSSSYSGGGAGIGGGTNGTGGTVIINGGTVTATGGYDTSGVDGTEYGGNAIGTGYGGSDSGTVTFGEGVGFVINAGKDKDNTSPMTTTEYETNHSAKYVKITPTSATTYTVTFNMNGHGEQIASYSNVASGSKIEAPTAPEEAGYTFGGWYKDEGCTEENMWKFDTDTVTADTTLYAKWTGNTYTVKFNSGDGNGTMADQTFTYGTPQKLSKNSFTAPYGRPNFLGWGKSPSDTSAYYSDEEEVTDIAPTETGTITLYAIWGDAPVPAPKRAMSLLREANDLNEDVPTVESEEEEPVNDESMPVVKETEPIIKEEPLESELDKSEKTEPEEQSEDEKTTPEEPLEENEQIIPETDN